jgi:hypothetical protein
MNAVDFRSMTFAGLRARIAGDRARVYDAFLCWGPGTTREVSDKARIDILTLRPRATELLQLGAIELLRGEGHEGVYGTRSLGSHEAWFNRRQREALEQQMDLQGV